MNFIAPETSDYRAIQPPSPEHVQDEFWTFKTPVERRRWTQVLWEEFPLIAILIAAAAIIALGLRAVNARHHSSLPTSQQTSEG